MVEYEIYSGDKFTIEWFYDENNKSDAKDYFEDLDEGQQRKFLYLVKCMGDIGEIRNKTKFRNEGDQIYAFKPQPERFLSFFYTGGKVIVTNAFEKRQDKLPTTEKKRALERKDNYIKRIKEGIYYAKEE